MTAAPTAEASALARREKPVRRDRRGGSFGREQQPVAPILINLAQRDTRNKSSEFATNALSSLGQVTDLLARSPHRQRQPGGVGGAGCSRGPDRVGAIWHPIAADAASNEHRFMAQQGRGCYCGRRGCPIFQLLPASSIVPRTLWQARHLDLDYKPLPLMQNFLSRVLENGWAWRRRSSARGGDRLCRFLADHA